MSLPDKPARFTINGKPYVGARIELRRKHGVLGIGQVGLVIDGAWRGVIDLLDGPQYPEDQRKVKDEIRNWDEISADQR